MLRFPISDLLDDQRCHDLLLRVLHPRGLRCPRGHPLPPEQAPHDRHRAPIFAYRCRECGAVYTLFTGSIWRGSRLPCSKIVLILRGIAHSVPTVHLTEELGLDRSHLLRRRHQIQSLVEERLFLSILSDLVTEADEMYQNAGEKGIPHRDPNDPPRRRANSRRGRGSWDNDRPAVVGVAGREHHSRRSLDRSSQPPTDVPRGQQEVPEPVRCGLRVGVSIQMGHRRCPKDDDGAFHPGHDMSLAIMAMERSCPPMVMSGPMRWRAVFPKPPA